METEDKRRAKEKKNEKGDEEDKPYTAQATIGVYPRMDLTVIYSPLVRYTPRPKALHEQMHFSVKRFNPLLVAVHVLKPRE